MGPRLAVTGLEHFPPDGPVLVVANHDSYWDPVVVGVAARRHRQVRALAKQSLWRNPIVGAVLDSMGQIPIRRGIGDSGALDAAVAALREGACVGVFPEGTISRGSPQRVRAGAGRLLAAVPEAVLVGAAVHGSVDMVRFPHRPQLGVHFLAEPGATDGESPQSRIADLMFDIRRLTPAVAAGRGRWHYTVDTSSDQHGR